MTCAWRRKIFSMKQLKVLSQSIHARKSVSLSSNFLAFVQLASKSVMLVKSIGISVYIFPVHNGKLWLEWTEIWLSVLYSRDWGTDLHPRRIKHKFFLWVSLIFPEKQRNDQNLGFQPILGKEYVAQSVAHFCSSFSSSFPLTFFSEIQIYLP